MDEPHVVNVDVNGTSLWVEVEGAGPPCLLVHGGSEDADLWADQAAELASTHTVIRYDRRGTNRSGRDDWPARGARSAEQHATDAAALLAALADGPAVVCGGSSGGVVALALACLFPDRCRHVIAHEPALLAETPEAATAGEQMRRAVAEARVGHDGDWAACYHDFLRSTGRPDGLTGLPEPRRSIEARNAESFCRDDLVELTTWTPAAERLADVADRVLLSIGSNGIPPLAGASRSLADRSGVSLAVIDGATHTPYIDAPIQLASLVERVTR